ncbi:MAG: divalent cation transporter [Candidatus Omnitrophica bacterium]|nr:divalent cation transporter [Candidatus Omnitrophota bacterium]
MMTIFDVIVYALIAGLTIFFGGVVARLFERWHNQIIESYIIHFSVAFGGGILIAAVAFVLSPKGIALFPIPVFTLIFLSGAFLFFLLDRFIEQRGGLFAQTMAMLMDFIPESIALGAVFVHNHRLGILLAFFIGFQNIPESFNAYFDLRKSGYEPARILLIFFILSFLGIGAALGGFFLLTNKDAYTAAIMLFSAGGILYLIFQDIAPSSKMRERWEPALGANLGFLIGMIGIKMFG